MNTHAATNDFLNAALVGIYTGIVRSLPTLLSVVVFALPAFAQAPDAFRKSLEAADRQIVRLPPTAFKQLPKNLVAELQRRGCTIPQSPMTLGQRGGLIRAEFAKPGQTDWAVLCSVGRVSSILVFWNGSETNPAKIAKMKDIDRLQSGADNMIVYSRLIEPVDRAYITLHYKAYGGPKPPPIDHKGINDIFVGKASVVYYFYKGKWLQLTGAD